MSDRFVFRRNRSSRLLPRFLALILAFEPVLLPTAVSTRSRSTPPSPAALWNTQVLTCRGTFFRQERPHSGGAIFRAVAPVRQYAKGVWRFLTEGQIMPVVMIAGIGNSGS